MFYVMTLSSLWNRERSCTVTVTGTIDSCGKTSKQIFNEISEIAQKAWRKTYSTISEDGFAVDFYHIQEN